MLRKTAKLHANNAGRCSKAPKETPHRIKAPPLCATHLKKVDENFNLFTSSVGASQRANLYLAIVPLFCPRKTLSFKALRGVWGALSRKRPPRVPLVPASPARTPSLSEVAADNGLGGRGGVVAVGSVFDNADNSYLRIDEWRIASEERI